MSVTYDDAVGVEVSSDSFWEVSPEMYQGPGCLAGLSCLAVPSSFSSICGDEWELRRTLPKLTGPSGQLQRAPGRADGWRSPGICAFVSRHPIPSHLSARPTWPLAQSMLIFAGPRGCAQMGGSVVTWLELDTQAAPIGRAEFAGASSCSLGQQGTPFLMISCLFSVWL